MLVLKYHLCSSTNKILFFSKLGFPWWLSGREPACNVGDMDLIPGSGRSPGVENGNSLQWSHVDTLCSFTQCLLPTASSTFSFSSSLLLSPSLLHSLQVLIHRHNYTRIPQHTTLIKSIQFSHCPLQNRSQVIRLAL